MSSLRDFIDEGPVGKRRLPLLAASAEIDEDDEDEEDEDFDDTEIDEAPRAAANDESPSADDLAAAQDGAE